MRHGSHNNSRLACDMSPLASALMRHIVACNNAALPGERTGFYADGALVGWVRPDAAAIAGTSVAGESLPAIGRRLAEAGLCRWRDEPFDVRARPDGPVIGTIDRGAISALGMEAAGVHLNAMVEQPDGLYLWVARRALDKKLDPGKLDHLVAGGVPAGLGPRETLIKEGAEEAGLSEALAGRAELKATLSYTMERPEGLRRDRLHCYDLMLPGSFEPVAVDGEVAGFELWPIGRVLDAVRDTELFKFNVNLVLIDLFLRLGLVQDEALAQALKGPL